MNSFVRRRRAAAGFTLIELMIVLVIVGILLAVAVPGYSEYLRRSNRASAQSFLQDLAQRQQQYFIEQRSYAASLGALNITLPTDVAKYYDITVAAVAGPPPGFTLTATPIAGGAQASDPTLSLDNTGLKLPAGYW